MPQGQRIYLSRREHLAGLGPVEFRMQLAPCLLFSLRRRQSKQKQLLAVCWIRLLRATSRIQNGNWNWIGGGQKLTLPKLSAHCSVFDSVNFRFILCFLFRPETVTTSFWRIFDVGQWVIDNRAHNHWCGNTNKDLSESTEKNKCIFCCQNPLVEAIHLREFMPRLDGRILTAANALVLCLFRMGNSLQLQTCITRKWFIFSLPSSSFASIRSTQRGGKWDDESWHMNWKLTHFGHEAVNLTLIAPHTDVARWAYQRGSAHAQTLLIPSFIVYQSILSLGRFHLQHCSPIRVLVLFLLSHRYHSEQQKHFFFVSSWIQCWKWIDICMLKCSGYHRFIYGLRTTLFEVNSSIVRAFQWASERVLPCTTCRYFPS